MNNPGQRQASVAHMESGVWQLIRRFSKYSLAPLVFGRARRRIADRLLIGLAMTGAFVLFTATLSNFSLGLHWGATAGTGASALCYFGLYVYLRRREPGAIAYAVIIVATFVSLAVLYVTNGGYSSSVPMFFVVAAAMFTAALPYRFRWRAALALAALATIMMGLDYWRPALIIPYSSEVIHRADTWAGLVVSLLVTTTAIGLIRGAYEKNTRRAERRNRLLSRVAGMERSLREAALLASRARTNMLAAVSHDIRTPLHTVYSLSELLAEDAREDQRESFEIMRTAARHLHALVNDMLDLSRIEAGRMFLEDGDFYPPDLIETIRKTHVTQALTKGLSLEVEIDPALELGLRGDRRRIEQILHNLAGNAVKFTARGSVRLIARLLDRTDARARVLFIVRDTGPGIPASRLGTIFEEFVQASEAVERRYGGTGLGLAITRRIVQLMEGRLEVESREGEGSEFQVELQFAVAAENSPERDRNAELVVDLSSISVLIVDDFLPNAEIAAHLIKRRGGRADAAPGGAEALQLLSARPYSIVLLDLEMPGVDGYETARRIRAPDFPRNQTPIIALSATSLTENIERALAAGMNASLGKPFTPTELYDVIRQYATAVE